ncbi:TPA: O-antigen ligase family protein [Streptococcus suis]
MLKIPKPNILGILIFTILALDSYCFYLIPSNSLNSPYNKYIIIILSFISFLCILKFSFKFYSERKFLSFTMLYVLFSVALVAFYSMWRYGQSLVDVFTSFYHFFTLFLITPLYFEAKRHQSLEPILKIVLWCSTFLCIVSIGQALLFNATRSIILPGITVDTYSIRNGHLRLTATSMNNIAFVYILSKIFDSSLKFRKKQPLLIILMLHLFTIYYVFMTRSFYIIYFGIAIIIYLSTNKTSKFIRWFILLVGSIFAFRWLDFSTFIESFSVDSSSGTGMSTINRLGAYHYFGTIIQKNPLFGMGFIRDSLAQYQTILHGPTGTYYVSDLGIFGLLAEMGLTGLSMFILMTIYLFYKLRNFKKMNQLVSTFNISFMNGMLGLWGFTSLNVIVTNPRYSLTMPFVFLSVIFVCDGLVKNSGNNRGEGQ